MKFIVVMILASLILGCGSIHNNGSGLLNSKDGDMPNLVVGGELVDSSESGLQGDLARETSNIGGY